MTALLAAICAATAAHQSAFGLRPEKLALAHLAQELPQVGGGCNHSADESAAAPVSISINRGGKRAAKERAAGESEADGEASVQAGELFVGRGGASAAAVGAVALEQPQAEQQEQDNEREHRRGPPPHVEPSALQQGLDLGPSSHTATAMLQQPTKTPMQFHQVKERQYDLLAAALPCLKNARGQHIGCRGECLCRGWERCYSQRNSADDEDDGVCDMSMLMMVGVTLAITFILLVATVVCHQRQATQLQIDAPEPLEPVMSRWADLAEHNRRREEISAERVRCAECARSRREALLGKRRESALPPAAWLGRDAAGR